MRRSRPNRPSGVFRLIGPGLLILSVLAGGGMTLSSCGNGGDGCDEGPDRSAQITIDSLRLVTARHGTKTDCHVQGMLRNGSDRELHVQVFFRAFDLGGTELEAVIHPTVPAGARVQLDAEFHAGLTERQCAEIARFGVVKVVTRERLCIDVGLPLTGAD